MVKVRDEYPLRHDGSLDLDGWKRTLAEQFDEPCVEQIYSAIVLVKELSDAAVVDKTFWVIDSLHMGLEMAQILLELRLDRDSIVAAVLYRSVREGRLPITRVRRDFGEGPAKLIESVLQMAVISALQNSTDRLVLDKQKEQLENLRKMVVSVIDDVRVALIKLAERTSAIRASKDLEDDARKRVAREIFNIYAPLAHRLGIGHLKWELEDLSFRYLHPVAYKKIATLLDEKRLQRQDYIKEVVARLKQSLAQEGIEGDVLGRAKHIYSIWRKMRRKNIDFSQVYDIRAVRILVPKVSDCYATLGIVHTMWRNIPNEFDDYIANPKENGYQSLHTAVVGPEGKVLEVQIRTHAMNEDAELGVCAHWLYKGTDTKGKDEGYEQKISWLRQVLEWQDDLDQVDTMAESIRADIAPERIYLFTPKGHVVDLPPKATALDFAYRVHTEVGHRCRGAKVNGRIVPLTYQLHTGEQVEVLTNPQSTPSRDWLMPEAGYLYTARARNKVAHWFRQQDREQNMEDGKRLLLEQLERLALMDEPLTGLPKYCDMNTLDDVFAGIGAGNIRVGSLIQFILKQSARAQAQHELPLLKQSNAASTTSEGHNIYVEGIGSTPVSLAKCCQPVPGEDIRGYVTKGRGVSIHRHDCDNLIQLEMAEPARVLQVRWGNEQQSYPIDIEIEAYDRTGLLSDVSSVMANRGLHISAITTQSAPDAGTARMSLTVDIHDMEQLLWVMNRLQQLSNVIAVRRITR